MKKILSWFSSNIKSRDILIFLLLILSYLSIYGVGIINQPQFKKSFWIIVVLAFLFLFLSQAWKQKTKGLIISLIVSFFFLDIANFIFYPIYWNKIYPSYSFRPHDIFEERRPEFERLKRYKKNVSYEGETYGNLSAMLKKEELKEYRKTKFVTDSLGFRNYPDTHKETLDVIVLGDSFSAGNGTTQDKMFSEILRQRYGLKVYNLGFPGSPWTEFMNLQIEFDKLKTTPNTVLLWGFFVGNDMIDNYENFFNAKELMNDNIFSYLHQAIQNYRKKSPFRILISRLNRRWNPPRNLFTRAFLNGEEMIFNRGRYYSRGEVKNHINYGNLAKTMKHLSKFAKERQIKVLFYHIPQKHHVYKWLIIGDPPWTTPKDPSPISQELEVLARRYGLDYLDLTPALIDASQKVYEEDGKTLWWYDDTHWNEKGNEVVAEIFYQNTKKTLKSPSFFVKSSL